jgi:hypothetical protein
MREDRLLFGLIWGIGVLLFAGWATWRLSRLVMTSLANVNLAFRLFFLVLLFCRNFVSARGVGPALCVAAGVTFTALERQKGLGNTQPLL